MAMDFFESNTSLSFYVDQLQHTSSISYWHYDASGELLSTTYPDPVMDRVFRAAGTFDAMMAAAAPPFLPILLSNGMEQVWCAVYTANEDVLTDIHVLGPVFLSRHAASHFEDHLHTPRIDFSWKPVFIDLLRRLPYLPVEQFFQEAIRLHYAANGTVITVSDIRYQQIPMEHAGPSSPVLRRNAQLSWMAEQTFLNSIRDGRKLPEEEFAELIPYMAIVKINLKNTLTNTKVGQSVYIALCIRAAIEGGLPPESAYARGDLYIQTIMEAQSVTEILQITHVAVEYFTEEVAKIKSGPGYSSAVRSTCDYIHLHPDKDLNISDLAARVGYADYYLSRKFKKETGKSVIEYIREVRIEEAKHLMETTKMTIPEIADHLHYGNRSVFSKDFKDLTGETPAVYISTHRHL